MRQSEGGSRPVLLALLASFAALPVGLAVAAALNSDVLFPDFFGLWSFGRFALTHAPAALYDEPMLHAYQAGLGMPPDRFYPFSYPPWILLLLAPLGALDYATARLVWLGLSLGGLVLAVGAWRWPPVLLACMPLAPAMVVCALVGQNGWLTAALMLGGLRCLEARPFAAGAMLAAIAYKPQMALLVPVLLLLGRHWRAMAGAGASAVALSLLATGCFGLGIWPAWAAAMASHAGELAAGRDGLLDKMPTITAAVRLLGGSVALAHAAQALGALAGVAALWRVRGRGDAASLAVLPLATVLATPYAFAYDLPMTAGAILGVLAADQNPPAVPLPILLAVLLAPSLLLTGAGMAQPVIPALLAAALWVVAHRAAAHPVAASRVARP